MLNKLFRNNSIVVSLGKGFGCSFFPCSPANVFLRTDTTELGVAWSGCGNYGWNVYNSVVNNAFTDGNCGEYLVHVSTYQAPAGHIFYNTGCCQVHYDGGTSYYIVDNCNPPCPPMGPTGSTRTVNPSSFQWTGCSESGTFDYAGDIEDEWHDGSCGYYWQQNGTWTASDGQIIFQNGANNCCTVVYTSYNNSYQVNDSCCAESGTEIRTETSDSTLNWSSCDNSGTWVYNTATTVYYADGNCGEYSAGSNYEQPVGTVIYDNGCCQVYYQGSAGYGVTDNCGPPNPPSGEATGNTGTQNAQTFNWTGCGTSGSADYYYENTTEYHDGMGGTYWSMGSSWTASFGDSIYDGGCCVVNHNGTGGYYENDTCAPPDYPDAGTELGSGSSDLTSNISAEGNDIDGTFHSENISVSIGTYDWIDYADGTGGSYTTSGNNYNADGTIYTYSYGLVVNLSWAVTDGGGSYTGITPVALNVPTWVLSSGVVSSGPTSFIDKLSEGYIIFETNDWWNGEANVKTRVEYQNGGGYITTTITF